MIGVGMIALAMALAYCAWCWRAEKRAVRAHETAHLNRADDTMKRAHAMMQELFKIRSTHTEPPAQPPFPAEGDNFTTLSETNVARPTFGQRKPDTQPDGVA